MYITGFRKSDIADWLNSNGYKTSYGNQFTLTAITPLSKTHAISANITMLIMNTQTKRKE